MEIIQITIVAHIVGIATQVILYKERKRKTIGTDFYVFGSLTLLSLTAAMTYYEFFG